MQATKSETPWRLSSTISSARLCVRGQSDREPQRQAVDWLGGSREVLPRHWFQDQHRSYLTKSVTESTLRDAALHTQHLGVNDSRPIERANDNESQAEWNSKLASIVASKNLAGAQREPHFAKVLPAAKCNDNGEPDT